MKKCSLILLFFVGFVGQAIATEEQQAPQVQAQTQTQVENSITPALPPGWDGATAVKK